MTGARVLVVEDDPSVRGLLETLLDSEGYQVSSAADGQAGLRQAAAVTPRLVLLDLMMPDLGGVRVLEELRADPALRQVPVIVVTGMLDAVESIEALIGPERVFVKPFGVAELLERVAQLTEEGR